MKETSIVTDLLKTIELIRDSFTNSIKVYTNGSCIRFALILKHLYPEGLILYDLDHAIFEYLNRCFDITGEVNKTDNHIPIMDYGIVLLESLLKLKY